MIDFYTASKVFWEVFRPSNFLCLMLVTTLIVSSTRSRRLRALFVCVSLAFIVLLVLPVGSWALSPLENRFTRGDWPSHVEGILVLGGGENPGLYSRRGVGAVLNSEGRLVTAVELSRRFPSARIVFSGLEAEVAQAAFQQMGIVPPRISFERRARNSWENLLFAKELAKPKPSETWLLVTQAYHMPRSVGIARKVGWKVVPWPVDYYSGEPFGFSLQFAGNLSHLDVAAHEWVGMLAYWATGRSAALFP